MQVIGRAFTAFIALFILGGCASLNSGIPGIPYLSVKAVDARKENVIAPDGETFSVSRTVENRVRATTVSADTGSTPSDAVLTWSMAVGVHVLNSDLDSLAQTVAPSIAEALTSCLPTLPSVDYLHEITVVNAKKIGAVSVAGRDFVQYPLIQATWKTIPFQGLGGGGPGSAVRVVDFEMSINGTQLPLSKSESLSTQVNVELKEVGGPSSPIIDFGFTDLDVSTIAGGCDGRKIRIESLTSKIRSGGWREPVKGPFDVDFQITSQPN